MDVGALVENVGTVFAVREAVVKGRPLIERVTTVTGEAVGQPSNLLARLGSRYSDLIAFSGGLKEETAKVISGGPMMGFAQADLEVTTSKTTSGIVLLPPDRISQFSSMPCISCGRCVAACPMKLMPSELSQMLEAEDFDGARDYSVMDCIECGCCAFVCPAHRPMVQHMKRGKLQVAAKIRAEREK
jgi:electron transport complex protein RnfC